MMKIRIKFRKYGTMKFIGHLDVMRYFQKAIRRAEVNIRYSEGFSPHQIMSFAAPLGVGITSKGEYVDIEVLDTENSKKMVDRLNAVMSEALKSWSTSFFQMMQQMLCLLWQQQITVLLSGRVMSRKMKVHRSGLKSWFNFLIQTM